MTLNTPTYTSDKFAWTGRMGVADFSEVRRIDNVPSQLIVISTRTGAARPMKRVSDVRQNGETVAFRFRSDDGIEVHLLND